MFFKIRRLARSATKRIAVSITRATPSTRYRRLLFNHLEDRRMLAADGFDWIDRSGGLGPGTNSIQAVDADGNFYVAGHTNGTLPGEQSAGLADGFVRKYDASGTEIWTRQFGTQGNDSVQGMLVDSTGIYLAGNTWGTFADAGRQNIDLVSDAYVRKYDLDGTAVWTRQFGTAVNDFAHAISIDSSGVYVVGDTEGRLPGQTRILTGFPDSFVRKYDFDGAELWTRQYGSSSPNSARGVIADGSSIYVAGYARALPGQINAGGKDSYVRKYDASGNEVWTRQFGAATDDAAICVTVDATGIYAAGWIDVVGPSGTSADVYVRKLDSVGNMLWTRQFGASQAADLPFGISANGAGVFVAGATYGSLPGQTNAGNQDAFVKGYDSDGNESWTRQFGTAQFDAALGVSVDATGLYVAGFTGGVILAGPDPLNFSRMSTAFLRKYDIGGSETWTRQFTVPSPRPTSFDSVDALDGSIYVAGATTGVIAGQTGAGMADAILRKYDSTGMILWTRQFGSSLNDSPLSVSVDASGIYVAGRTEGSLPGQANLGGADAFVTKFDADGNQVWTRQLGSSLSDVAFGVATGPSGVYVAGTTDGTLPGQISAGGSDAFVQKYDANGTLLWTRQFGAPGTDQVLGVAVNGLDLYVTGQVRGTLPGQASAGSIDAFARKYDAAGNEIWTRQFGTGSFDQSFGIAASDSAVYVGGVIWNGNALPGQESAGSEDAFVRKYDSNGTEVWTRQFGTPNGDTVNELSADASGIYLAGHTTGALPGQTHEGSVDAFVRKYDLGGNEVWTRQFGSADPFTENGTGSEFAFGVAADIAGIFVVGSASGYLEGQAGLELGGFVAKMNQPATISSFSIDAAECGFAAEGDAVSIMATFSDPEVPDTHTATIDWGDGSITTGIVTESDGSGIASGTHVYTAGGIYTITITVIDDHSNATASVTTAVITGAGLRDGVLQIVGTDAADQVSVNKNGNSQAVVTANFLGASTRTYSISEINRIQASLCDGNDDIEVAGSITLSAWLYGGEGNDRLKGGGGADVLLGEGGDDLLVGGDRRDVLIGGMGADRAVGNADDDILIAGYTSFTDETAALLAIMTEWTSSGTYAERNTNLSSTHLRTEGPTATIHDDNAKDTLTGSSGQDWFFANLVLDSGDDATNKDKLTDLSSLEFAADLDFILD
jgi:PKD domain/RTX calcium-binding nonapeptide repeat (4 copies)/Beta-propeller repeat